MSSKPLKQLPTTSNTLSTNTIITSTTTSTNTTKTNNTKQATFNNAYMKPYAPTRTITPISNTCTPISQYEAIVFTIEFNRHIRELYIKYSIIILLFSIYVSILIILYSDINVYCSNSGRCRLFLEQLQGVIR